MKNYEFIEHTADIGIKVKGQDLQELFKNAALAMFDIIGELKPDSSVPATVKIPKFKVDILQNAETLEELFVNWLNELLSLSAVKGLIFSDFKIDKLSEKYLEAAVIGGDIKNYKINTEVKAATYHELEIKKINSEWQAKIIFDV